MQLNRQSKVKFLYTLCTYLIALLMLVSQVQAQPSSASESAKDSKANQSDELAQTKVTESGKVIEFKQLNLEGTVQKPSAAFLQGRKKIKFKGLAPKKSFIGEIKKSVKKYPF